MVDKEQSSVEEPEQMSGFISIVVGERGEEAAKVGVGGYALSWDKKLIHAHGSIEGKGHSWKIFDISFLDGSWGVLSDEIHQFVNTHWRPFLYYIIQFHMNQFKYCDAYRSEKYDDFLIEYFYGEEIRLIYNVFFVILKMN